jgi:hypothetical protein
MKGQVSFVNIFGFVVIIMLYCIFFLPVTTPLIQSGIGSLDPAGQFYGATSVVLALSQVFVLIVILLGFLAQAQPRYG